MNYNASQSECELCDKRLISPRYVSKYLLSYSQVTRFEWPPLDCERARLIHQSLGLFAQASDASREL